jgi:hypothetical protein
MMIKIFLSKFFLKFTMTNREKPSHSFIETRQSWLRSLSKYIPILLTCAVFLSVISFKITSLPFGLLISSIIAAIVQKIGEQRQLSKQWLIFLQILISSVILSIFLLDYFSAPVQAQFFKKAEDFFQNTLTQGTTTTDNTRTAVSLVFNVLRAIYLLYIAGSLVGVINAVRKDEEWQSIARIPLLVVIAVTIADVLTNFIIGDISK